MSVTSLQADPIRSGPSGGDNDRSEFELREVYQARVDSLAETPYSVLVGAALLGLPAVYDAHPGNAAAKVVRREAKRTDEPKVWEIELTYSTKTEVQERSGTANPLERFPEITFGFTKYSRVLERDLGAPALPALIIDGTTIIPARAAVGPRPIMNSSRQAFDPPMEVDDSRPTITVRRYESSFSAALAVQYQDAINSDNFAGSPPETWKVMNISAVETVENGQVVFRVTYEFEGRREGWARRVLDQGTVRWDYSTGKQKQIVGSDGMAVSQPVLLNGDGRPLSEARSTLDGAIAANQGTLSIQAADIGKFPSLSTRGIVAYTVKIDSEELLVYEQAVTPEDWTVLRGINGTTQAAHSNGATVTMEPFYHIWNVYQPLPFAALGLPL